MRQRELFRVGLSLAAPVLLLAGVYVTGCGGGGVNTNPTPTPGPSPTPGPTPTPTLGPTPSTADLVFVSNNGHNVDLWFLGPGGGAPNRLTSDPSDDVQPSLSADKRTVVFSARGSASSLFDAFGNPEIYTINVNTRVVQRLTHDMGTSPPDDVSPALSQAGDRIAWLSTRGGKANIWTMAVTGANQQRLTHETTFALDPAWSPDGTRIAYVTLRGGDSTIVVRNVSSGAEQVLNTGNASRRPRFSPDGTRLVFETTSGTLRLINIASGSITDGPNAGLFNRSACWSNDGTRIIFSARGGTTSNEQIFSANVDGSGVQRLTNNADENTSPSTGGASG